MDMIEKMARAIWRERWIEPEPEVLPPEQLGPAQSDWEHCKEVYFRDARAALSALQEPTHEMYVAGAQAIDGETGEKGRFDHIKVFTAMIQAVKEPDQ